MRASPRGWGVGALVVDADERVLLVQENGQWYVPGGRLEADESPETGAIREVREETGVDVRLRGLGAIAEQTFSHETTGESFVFRFGMFKATPETTEVANDPGLPDESISSVEWHTSVPADTYTRDLVVELLG
ncbi:NUDIX hydrolase [Halocatena pleomorpha]|uniref:NUDIX hydrolase n=2 Tax=Halocatena pleomorpha TaxID=1785090 RepID=A0A3P3R796_9EURY|nr:NUDIX hydrolase [Halocatena pleomorpha]